MIYNSELDAMVFCECRERKQYERILKNSGISEAFRKKSFRNYSDKGIDILKKAKKKAVNYIKKFDEIRNTEKNSIAFLGQVGAGKTHLSIAIANNLMSKNIGVLYMQYREDIVKIKQVANDEINYSNAINPYKNASVLLIDDLFKKATYKDRLGNEILNDADARVMFEIINYRYLKRAPIIVSSEYTVNKLLDLDEAIGSRIIQMCEDRTIEFVGEKLNHRLYKLVI